MSNRKKPLVVVTRKLPDNVETRMRELFDTRLNLDDPAGVAAIADDGPLQVLLENAPVGDVELERCLVGIRSIILDVVRSGTRVPPS